MADGIKRFVSDQPILAGCLGFVGCGGLIGVGLLAAALLGARACSNATGVDGLFDAVASAQEAGFGFQLFLDNGELLISMPPMELLAGVEQPRSVTCEELGAVLIPHLTGYYETVRVTSASLVETGGELREVPLECTWGGYPKPGSAGAPEAASDEPAVEPSAEPVPAPSSEPSAEPAPVAPAAP